MPVMYLVSKKALSNYDWRPDSSASRALEQYSESPGPSCSKLTTLLVNDSSRFTSSDTQIF